MGCGNCGSGGCSPAGCGNNGTCGTSGCNKLNTYDWLQHMVLPEDYEPFNIVEVRFKGSRKEFYKNTEHLDLFTGDPVVVESEMGHDLGHVSLSGELVRLQLKKYGVEENHPQMRKIYRKASESDLKKYTECKDKESAMLERARTIAMSLRLEMKLSDIEIQGDARKVIFFYTSEGRVDFRELIKRYAGEFKMRIEMRQISYREEASRLGGIGSCGRELCCSTWLTDYKVVSMSAAKTQNLSINMLKLSGQCGRLKCCLNYELDTYMEALHDFPNLDKLIVETQVGQARPQKIDILKRQLWLSYDNTSDWHAVSLDRILEIVELNRKGQKPDTLNEEVFEAELENKLMINEDLLEKDFIERIEEKSRKQQQQKKKKKKGGRPQGNLTGATEQGSQTPKAENRSPENRSNPEQGQRNRGPRNNRRRKGGNKGPDKGSTPTQ